MKDSLITTFYKFKLKKNSLCSRIHDLEKVLKDVQSENNSLSGKLSNQSEEC